MKKTTVLAILFWTVHLAYLTSNVLLPIDVVESVPYILSSTAILLFSLFAWFLADADEIGFKPSTGLKIAVLLFSAIAIPYYRFRHTGFKKGMFFIAKVFGIYVFLSVLLWTILSTLLPEPVIERIFKEHEIETFEKKTLGGYRS